MSKLLLDDEVPPPGNGDSPSSNPNTHVVNVPPPGRRSPTNEAEHRQQILQHQHQQQQQQKEQQQQQQQDVALLRMRQRQLLAAKQQLAMQKQQRAEAGGQQQQGSSTQQVALGNTNKSPPVQPVGPGGRGGGGGGRGGAAGGVIPMARRGGRGGTGGGGTGTVNTAAAVARQQHAMKKVKDANERTEHWGTENDPNSKRKPPVGGCYRGARNDRGEPHGLGQWMSPTVEYQGEYLNGLPHGRGEMKRRKQHQQQRDTANSPSPSSPSRIVWSYQGDFLCGKRHGFGQCHFVDARATYRGNWHKGEMCGRGRYVTQETGPSSPASVYNGEFIAGKRHGLGFLFFPVTQSGYKGGWKEGQPHGPGRYVEEDGSCYDGTWVEGRRAGTFTMRKPNGQCFETDYDGGFNSRVVAERRLPEQDHVGAPQSKKSNTELLDEVCLVRRVVQKTEGSALKKNDSFLLTSQSGPGPWATRSADPRQPANNNNNSGSMVMLSSNVGMDSDELSAYPMLNKRVSFIVCGEKLERHDASAEQNNLSASGTGSPGLTSYFVPKLTPPPELQLAPTSADEWYGSNNNTPCNNPARNEQDKAPRLESVVAHDAEGVPAGEASFTLADDGKFHAFRSPTDSVGDRSTSDNTASLIRLQDEAPPTRADPTSVLGTPTETPGGSTTSMPLSRFSMLHPRDNTAEYSDTEAFDDDRTGYPEEDTCASPSAMSHTLVPLSTRQSHEAVDELEVDDEDDDDEDDKPSQRLHLAKAEGTPMQMPQDQQQQAQPSLMVLDDVPMLNSQTGSSNFASSCDKSPLMRSRTTDGGGAASSSQTSAMCSSPLIHRENVVIPPAAAQRRTNHHVDPTQAADSPSSNSSGTRLEMLRRLADTAPPPPPTSSQATTPHHSDGGASPMSLSRHESFDNATTPAGESPSSPPPPTIIFRRFVAAVLTVPTEEEDADAEEGEDEPSNNNNGRKATPASLPIPFQPQLTQSFLEGLSQTTHVVASVPRRSHERTQQQFEVVHSQVLPTARRLAAEMVQFSVQQHQALEHRAAVQQDSDGSDDDMPPLVPPMEITRRFGLVLLTLIRGAAVPAPSPTSSSSGIQQRHRDPSALMGLTSSRCDDEESASQFLSYELQMLLNRTLAQRTEDRWRMGDVIAVLDATSSVTEAVSHADSILRFRQSLLGSDDDDLRMLDHDALAVVNRMRDRGNNSPESPRRTDGDDVRSDTGLRGIQASSIATTHHQCSPQRRAQTQRLLEQGACPRSGFAVNNAEKR